MAEPLVTIPVSTELLIAALREIESRLRALESRIEDCGCHIDVLTTSIRNTNDPKHSQT